MYYVLYIQSLTGRHLDCFHLLNIVENAAIFMVVLNFLPKSPAFSSSSSREVLGVNS